MSNATPRQRVRLALADTQQPVPHVPSGAKPAGDKRPPGRPPGARNRLSNAARAHAEATGELPHMFLLRITRGEVISTDVMDPVTGDLKKVYQVPDLPMRMDAAKAAAPYFAPKLSSVEVVGNLSDQELDSMLHQYGAQAGVAVVAKKQASEDDEDAADGPPPDNVQGWLSEDDEDQQS